MSNTFARAFSTLAAIAGLALSASAQSVISTHSGVIYFSEGAVYVGDQPLERYPGKFPSVPQGAELRTADGRAEVLLTPGVFLRMGERRQFAWLRTTWRTRRSNCWRLCNPGCGRTKFRDIGDLDLQGLEGSLRPKRQLPDRFRSAPACRVRTGEAEVFAATCSAADIR